MPAARVPHPLRNHPRLTRVASDAFWAAAVALIALYVFLASLGAFSPGDLTGVTVAIAVLTALWILRAVVVRRAG